MVDIIQNDRSLLNRIADYSSIAFFTILWVLLAIQAYTQFTLQDSFLVPTLILLLSLLLSIVTADFLSGLAHFTADNFGDEDMLFFGKRWIMPFRNHHIRPYEIIQHNFAELNGNTGLLCIPIIALAICMPNEGNNAYLFWTLFVLFVTVELLFTNSIHRWAHMKNPPWFPALLQKYHIILSPEHHKRHHTYPFSSHFCITTGWLNGIFNKSMFVTKNREKVSKEALFKNKSDE